MEANEKKKQKTLVFWVLGILLVGIAGFFGFIQVIGYSKTARDPASSVDETRIKQQLEDAGEAPTLKEQGIREGRPPFPMPDKKEESAQ